MKKLSDILDFEECRLIKEYSDRDIEDLHKIGPSDEVLEEIEKISQYFKNLSKDMDKAWEKVNAELVKKEG